MFMAFYSEKFPYLEPGVVRLTPFPPLRNDNLLISTSKYTESA